MVTFSVTTPASLTRQTSSAGPAYDGARESCMLAEYQLLAIDLKY
jgi:hypothetical protein